MEKVRASIVVYKNEPALLLKAMESFLDSPLAGLLTVIDNSPTDSLRKFIPSQVNYIFNNKNLGYGKAHNLAMKESLSQAVYHLVLNPDVSFKPNTIERIFHFMESQHETGLVMPKVLDPDGELQMLCKLLPTPLNLVTRRFSPSVNWFKKLNDRYEMKVSGYDRVMSVPFLSGCFMFFRTSALKEVGLFDERFFLYAEDTDLSRRMHQKYNTLFFPGAEISHVHARGSYKNIKLTLCNALSAFQYFNKWGWFFDSERQEINLEALAEATDVTLRSESFREIKAA